MDVSPMSMEDSGRARKGAAKRLNLAACRSIVVVAAVCNYVVQASDATNVTALQRSFVVSDEYRDG